MRVLLLAVAVVCCSALQAQVTVRESGTHAHQVNGATTITLPVQNAFLQSVEARVDLAWLSPNNKQNATAVQTVSLKPGETSLEIPLPIGVHIEPMAERLSYEISPGYRNLTTFDKTRGVLSLPNIADFAFTVRALTLNLPRPDQPYEIRVLASHPLTGQPVTGVNVSWGSVAAVTDQSGLAVLTIALSKDISLSDHEIMAKLGDFQQTAELQNVELMPEKVTIQLDKPVYQPGQTMHVRFLAIGANGRADSGAEYQVKITGSGRDVEHAAKLTTSSYGIASTDWPIPVNAKTGQYEISVKDDEREIASREVAVRKYELPTFKVTAHGVRSYYVPHQVATLEVSAAYLFGKPLTKGRVQITEDDVDFARGPLDANGMFRKRFPVDDQFDRWEQFKDRQFTAFVTDTTTNRTEQTKFALRISKHSLHIYLAKEVSRPEGRRLYVTTYSPDGTIAQANVQVIAAHKALTQARSNRYGIARVDIGATNGDILLRARTDDGRQAEIKLSLTELPDDQLWLLPERLIYRPGEVIHCQLASTRRDLTVQVTGWGKEGRTVFSRSVRLNGATASIEIPYAANFGRELHLAAAAGPLKQIERATIIFPGPDNLQVKASSPQTVYQPGETARLEFQTSAQAALGIAVVDESVMERAATDNAFGSRNHDWFEANPDGSEPVSYSKLLNMNPAKIDADIELLAEVEQPVFWITQTSEDPKLDAQNSYRLAIEKSLEPLKQRLDLLYNQRLEYPKDIASFIEMGDPTLRDLWLQPYDIRFSVQGGEDVMEVCTSGPDKTPNTKDDFCTTEIRRSWFVREESLIRDALKKLEDYPASMTAVLQVLGNAGIHFSALKDPWQTPLRLELEYQNENRIVKIRSAGPDKQFGTPDDVLVSRFSGTYFGNLGRKIQKAIDATDQFPATVGEFSTLARASGVDIERIRDPWGRKYFVNVNVAESYFDKVTFYTYGEYGRVEETLKQRTPARHRVISIELRCAGKDGRRGTGDDFAVYRFSRVVEELVEKRQAKETLPRLAAGTGTLLGTLKDPSGAGVANAKVTLNGVKVAVTNEAGKYAFAALPSGVYRLTFDSLGFMRAEGVSVPVAANGVTEYNFVLQVGNAAQTIEVKAEPTVLQTMSSISSSQQVSSLPVLGRQSTFTPRVREYFPETLYWQPELVTDSAGHATVDVKLADTITTWHVAVIASTQDGKLTETATDVQAFQPFQADLDLPPVLTVGDRLTLPLPVRNYTDQPQQATVKAQADTGLVVEHPTGHTLVIGKGASANAVVDLRAESAAEKARLQVTAVGSSTSDAIAKSTRIHPDGERMEKSVTSILGGIQTLHIDLPKTAMIGSIKGEVKVYPTLLARLFESIDAVLQRPDGCGEQIISSSYPNLLILRALKQSGITDEKLQVRALQNLQIGYERLLGYQTVAGGFAYWHKYPPDAAVTGYALEFLGDLKEFMKIDEARVDTASAWLAKQPGSDKFMLDHITELAKKSAEFSDPYEMAAFASAAIEAKKPELAESTIRRLADMAQDEQGSAYWAMRTNTPFHGWGRTGQVETTAMVVSALARSGKAEYKPLIQRGVLFLLKNTNRSGVWGSGQATVRALIALLETVGKTDSTAARPVDVLVTGSVVEKLMIREERTMAGPITVDVSKFLSPGGNKVSLRSDDSRPVETQFNAEWYEPWNGPHLANEFSLAAKFSCNTVQANETVKCFVTVSRPLFRGYGMMIAEVGLPPGAEVDRRSLEATLNRVDSYEISPDHVTFYVWPQAKDVRFDFTFRPRFGMTVRTAQSVLYDYYNPDARTILAPSQFSAR